MPKADLESKIDALYRLAPEEFTAARNALAKGLDRADADRVKALAKPSLAAWAVNQLYWKERTAYEDVVRSVTALRAAHERIMGGGKADLAELIADRRSAIKAAENLARETILETGHPLTDATRDAIAQTLEALPAEGPPGRLTGPLGPRGFEIFADTAAAVRGAAPLATPSSQPRKERTVPKGGRPAATSKPAGGDKGRAALQAQRRTVDAAVARRLKAEQAEARRAAAAAERAVFAAKRDADTARREARDVHRELDRLRAQADRLRDELEQCETRAKSAKNDAAEKDQRAAEADSALAKALADLDAAKTRERGASAGKKKS